MVEIQLDQGGAIERVKPGHPQQNGRHERMHLTLKKEAKGGRLRFVAIRNDDQRSALDLALQFALHPSSHLGHPGLSLKQSLKRFDNVMQKAGITKRQLRVTAHGLRNQFAHEFHVELTNAQAPVRGGNLRSDAEVLKAALLEIARQLGHDRPTITNAYLGSQVRKSQSVPSSETEQEDLA
jgi:integrase